MAAVPVSLSLIVLWYKGPGREKQGGKLRNSCLKTAELKPPKRRQSMKNQEKNFSEKGTPALLVMLKTSASHVPADCRGPCLL
jgi:hypothetical protein